MKDPRDDFPLLTPSGSHAGCGCILPGSGLLLVVLTIALVWTLRSRTEGWTPLYLVPVLLVLGIILLFVRIRWSGR